MNLRSPIGLSIDLEDDVVAGGGDGDDDGKTPPKAISEDQVQGDPLKVKSAATVDFKRKGREGKRHRVCWTTTTARNRRVC